MARVRPFERGSNVAALFHCPNALGLPDIVLGDGDWRQLYHLFRRFLAVAQERNKYVNRAAGLATRLLLDRSGQVAGLLPLRAPSGSASKPMSATLPTRLCWILGDGVDQAADISWFATSIPSRNFTPRTIFGN